MTRSPFFAALVLCALPVFALDPAADYARMQKWQFSEGIPLAGPVTIARDTATWTLESGTVRLMEPLSDGTVTGLVFEGKGRLTMTVPDRFELAQLRRFAAKKELAQIDEPFTQLIVRSSDPALIKLFPGASGAYAPLSLAEKRHEFWLEHLRRDTDAFVLAAMLNPGMTALVIDAKTEAFDWLMYEYDSWRTEEITLSKFRGGARETWVSLDRPEDRRPDGRPGTFGDPATLVHIDVRADLTKRGRIGEVGDHGQHSLNGDYVVDATYTAGATPLGALRLDLHPIAREVTAEDANGNALTILRDHVGKRFADIDNRVYDDDLVLVLPSPLQPGQKTTVRFRYEWESANYAPGGAWYPTISDSMLRPHTARLELTVHRKNEARAMGRLEKRTENDKTETTVWVIDKPTKMVTFSTATRFEEVKLAPEGIPPVIAFGPDYQLGNRDKVRNVGADVANSMQFFQHLLDDKLDVPQFYVTSIAAGHGQAFEGFLHMGEFTFESEHPGASELFRAHEVAHEWFGHKVGWATYRDQWLSEAFAEYAAMMFVQGFVRNGDKFFDEILRSYHGIVKGQPFAGGFSKFNRPSLARLNLNAVERERVGPIGHGFRANTSEIPGYAIQSYFKGPLVLHMLRSILRFRTKNDELFVKILREYIDLAEGKYASTDDFRRIVEKNAGPGWQAFFDSWVYGAEIPSYAWSYTVAPAGDGFELTVKVRRSGVSPDFMTVIPVEVNFDGDGKGYVFIVNRKDEESVTHKLPQKPKSVVFAPEYSVLGQIRRE
jgi:Peptidase family M1 domain